MRDSSAETRPTRAICSAVSSGACARAATASANSRMIRICDTIRACAAFAGISVANSCISRATRACRQAGDAIRRPRQCRERRHQQVGTEVIGIISRMTSGGIPLVTRDMQKTSRWNWLDVT